MRFIYGFITMNCTTIWEKSCYFLQASKGSNSKLMIEWMMKYIEIGENASDRKDGKLRLFHRIR